MYFAEWCLSTYGISEFTEGKIVNNIFLPAYKPLKLDKLITKNKGRIFPNDNNYGILITRDNYEKLIEDLHSKFESFASDSTNETEFKNFKNDYFHQIGVDSSKARPFKRPPNIHIVVDNKKKRNWFLNNFADYNPQLSHDVLTGRDIIEMPSHFLHDLYSMYYSDFKSEIYRSKKLEVLKERYASLAKLKYQIEFNPLYWVIHSAHNLALDYDNIGPATIFEPESCMAYAMSLKVFAEISRDILTPVEYQSLLAASNLLAAYDKNFCVKQSLKTDCNFIDYLRKRYHGNSNLTQSNLSTYSLENHPEGAQILALIDKDIDDQLNGCNRDQTAKNIFIAQRFFPDHEGQSETDELILHGGGMLGHFALWRLIKVGVLENGEETPPGTKPHHYVYFKIENNVGINAHGINSDTKSCWGTYVTKIRPFTCSETGKYLPLKINPATHPQEYQEAMAFTLRELIKVERQLLFYRKPDFKGENNNSFSPLGSVEANEWIRLNKLKQRLSGYPYRKPIHYLARDKVDPSIVYSCSIKPQRDYIQEGGSCAILSIKALMISVLGRQLAVLHSYYMQHHNREGHLASLEIAKNSLKAEIISLTPSLIKSTFFYPQPQVHADGIQPIMNF